MATIKHYKVVAALPSTLVADSIYLVRVGTGFDLYVTNSSGTIVAYPANYQAGSANLNALSGLSGAANKAPYFTAAGAMAVYDLTVFGRSFAAAADQAAGRTLLGLDTAATRAATTSPTDTTSERLWRTNDLVKQTGTTDHTTGRVMLTGAGGLLGTAEDLGSGFDWNNLGGRSRLVRGALNSTVNGPFTGAYWLMGLYITLDSSGNNAVFHGSLVVNTTVRHFTRSKVGGAWYGWVEEWHSGNTLSLGTTPASARTAMELDTAATRAATTSPTDTTSECLWRTNDLVKQTGQKDTTAGRVMLTGAGGWMGTAPFLTGNDYNNDSEYCGIIKNDNSISAVNYPPQIAANAPMAAINVRFNGSYGWQLGVQTPGASPSDANTRAFLRCEVGGAWSSWAELWHSGNLDNTESGWLTPTLVNSYTHGTDPVRYRRVGKFVVVTGSLRRSSPPTALQTICTLPAGYRPAKEFTTTVLWVSDNLAMQATSIAISTDGAIVVGPLYALAGTPSGAGGASFTLIFPVG